MEKQKSETPPKEYVEQEFEKQEDEVNYHTQDVELAPEKVLEIEAKEGQKENPEDLKLKEEKSKDSSQQQGKASTKEKKEEEIVQTEEQDTKSVCVKNVDYLTTIEEVKEHFKECGNIVRVTIPNDKFTGNPRGYAFIEFESLDGVENAKSLSDSIIHGRQIKVEPKRTNVPNFSKKRGGRFMRGMGMPYYPRNPYMRGFMPPYRMKKYY